MAHSFPAAQDITEHVDVDLGGVKVGFGGYGDIYKGELKAKIKGHTGTVAVKMTRYNFEKVPVKVVESFRKELDIWAQLDHPNVLLLLGFYTYGGVKCPVSPWCESGTILDYCKDARDGLKAELEAPITDCDFDELRLHCLELELLAQVTDGLAYLHRKNIVHGDIKSNNILVNNGVACLTDFGLSVFLEHSRNSTSSNLGASMRWTAPEYFEEHAHHTREGDMWAFGCVILEVRMLQHPYHGVRNEGVPLAIPKADPYRRPEVIHPSLWDIAKGCWMRTPIAARKPSQTVFHALKQLLKSLRTMREAFASLPNVKQIEFHYRRYMTSPDPAPAWLSLARDVKFSEDPFVSLAIRTVVMNLEASVERYAPDVLSPLIRTIAVSDSSLGRELMSKLSSASLWPPFHGHASSAIGSSSPQARISATSVVSLPGNTELRAGMRGTKNRSSMADSLVEPLDLTATVDVSFNHKVASGGYKDVYKGRLTRDVNGHSGEVVVKVTRFILANIREKVMTGIEEELSIWQQLRHPYILPLIGVYLYHGVPCAVSPWCDRGTILEYIQSAFWGYEPELDAPESDCDFDLLRLHCLEMKLLWEVAEGLAYLHRHNIAHGDMKASNILVKGGVAQLGDFGFSVILAERASNTSSHLGTYRWFAPESLQAYAHRTREADMWAFGCVILEIRTLLVPYHQVHEASVPVAILQDRPYERPNDIHPSLWSMAKACWSRSPEARILSPTLASRMKVTLKYATLFRKALGVLPDIQSLDLGYRNPKPPTRFSVGAVFSKKGDNNSLDLTLASVLAHKALLALEAIASPQLAEKLTLKVRSSASPELPGSPLRGHIRAVTSVTFLQNGRRILSVSRDKTLRIWDIKTRKKIIGRLVGRTDFARCVVHGSRIASCSSDGTFRVWDADRGTPVLGPISTHGDKRSRDGIATAGDYDSAAIAIAYSRDGMRIATAGDYDSAAIWDANTGVQSRGMLGHRAHVMCVAFSEDGTRIVSGSKDNTVRIWDVASGESIGKPLTGHTELVTAVCFSLDDKRIFSSSYDHTIRIWDAETTALMVEPLRMDDQVRCMALSPDGKRLVSGSQTGKIALWDAETGDSIPNGFKDHEGPVWSVAFSPDGRKIASGLHDGSIALWDATDDWKRWDVEDEVVEKDDD